MRRTEKGGGGGTEPADELSRRSPASWFHQEPGLLPNPPSCNHVGLAVALRPAFRRAEFLYSDRVVVRLRAQRRNAARKRI